MSKYGSRGAGYVGGGEKNSELEVRSRTNKFYKRGERNFYYPQYETDKKT